MSTPASNKKLRVSGWFPQLFLPVLGAIALLAGNPVQAAVFVTGAAIIGVMRQLEKERRAS